MKMKLHWQILIALTLSIPFGIIFPNAALNIEWVGTIFLRGLSMVVVPLVFSSLVSGVANIGSSSDFGRLGGKTIGYYMLTSLIALLVGLILVNIFKPGVGATGFSLDNDSLSIAEKSLKETLIEIIPNNIFAALQNGKMLSIIVFAMLFGFFITKVEYPYKENLTLFFSGTFEVMMKITLFVIKFAPLGIFSIVAAVVATQADVIDLIFRLGKFMLVVIGGLLFHGLVFLPLLLWFFGRINPIQHYKAMSTTLLTAFSTASSNATLPITMETMEKKVGVSNKVASFSLPLGATINMDGTALYELVVAGFVAQVYGIELSLTSQFIIVLTALLSSIGTAGVPMASLVTMAIVFKAVDLPLEGIALILPVDRPLDMLRTATNVFSDTCGASIIAKSEGEKLKY